MNAGTGYSYERNAEAITRQSFDIIAGEADFSGIPDDLRQVAERIVHACGMVDILGDLDWSEGAGSIGRTAMNGGADVICDAAMVAAGITRAKLPAANVIRIAVQEPAAVDRARAEETTKSAGGISAAGPGLDGAVVVIGNAPTALFRVLELFGAGTARPALVLGFPVGFVGAAEAKRALAESGLDFITVQGRRGGSAMAAAAVNALCRDANAP